MNPALCETCFTEAPSAACGGCQRVQYCGRACAEYDWEEQHQVECVGKRARSRLSARQQDKVARVMREFSHGRLTTRGGRRVTDRKQALAIAYAEARRI